MADEENPKRKTVDLTPVDIPSGVVAMALGRTEVLQPVPRFRWVAPAATAISNIIGALPTLPRLQQLHIDTTGRMGEWRDVPVVYDNGQGVSNVWDGR